MANQYLKKNIGWAIFFLAIAGAGAASLAALIGIQSDQKGAVLFGFSIQRILMIVFVAIPTMVSFAAGLRAALRPRWVDQWLEPNLHRLVHLPWVKWFCAAAALLGWLGLFLSPEILGRYQAYFIRLRPVLVFVGFCAALGYAVIGIQTHRWSPKRAAASLSSQRGWLLASAAVMAALCGLWLLIALTGLGVDADPFFWNEAGAPVLGLQLIFSILLAMIIQRWIFSQDPAEKQKGIDWGVAALLWLGGLLLWQFTFMPRSYFAPGPYPPNMAYYPYSDAERYDYSAQYLLLGQGIANGEFMDKPAYVFLLAFLHLIAGQDFRLLVGLQVALLALTPVGLYLLGKTLHNRLAGLIIALLAIFQQRNAIAATLEIQVSHSKLLLTEYPAALLLIFSCLFAVRWFQAPGRRPGALLISGGLLGLAALIRPNTLLLVPLLIVLALVRWPRKLRRGVAASAWFTLVALLTLLPWNLVIPKGFDTPYLIAKARSLLDTRYKLPEVDSTYLDQHSDIQVSTLAKYQSVMHLAAPGLTEGNKLQEQRTSYSFIPRHFFHNEIMAFFILPHSIVLKNLEQTLQAPYWQSVGTWRGELPAGSFWMILLNLGLLAIGIGSALKRWRLAGLIPLLMQMFYYLANAVVRNSGARYLVPVDWVLLLYYVMGWVQVLFWLRAIISSRPYDLPAAEQISADGGEQNAKPLRWQRGALIAGLFLFVGSWLPLSKYLFPPQLPGAAPEEILGELKTSNRLDERLTGWLNSLDENQSINHPEVAILRGRGYYPRYYEYEQGESDGELALKSLPAGPEPHFTMRLLTKDRAYVVVLPTPRLPSAIPDDVDTVVIGCRHGEAGHIDAAAVLIMTEDIEILWRETNVELTCPMPSP